MGSPSTRTRARVPRTRRGGRPCCATCCVLPSPEERLEPRPHGPVRIVLKKAYADGTWRWTWTPSRCCAGWPPACPHRACTPSSTRECWRRRVRGEGTWRRRHLPRRPRRAGGPAGRQGPASQSRLGRGWQAPGMERPRRLVDERTALVLPTPSLTGKAGFGGVYFARPLRRDGPREDATSSVRLTGLPSVLLCKGNPRLGSRGDSQSFVRPARGHSLERR